MKNKGISLIVLVITIIVMIILAGSIILSLSNSKIIEKARNAKEQSNLATIRDAATLINADLQLGLADGSIALKPGQTEEEYIKEQLVNQGFSQLEVERNGVLKGGKVVGAPIPKGFYYVGGTRDTGIVISDNKEDENKGDSYSVISTLLGNQFVWVPVNSISDFKRGKPVLLNGSIVWETLPSEYKEYSELPVEAQPSEYKKMYESVNSYKGFYIARYEAGIGQEVLNNSTDKRAKANGTVKPVSKHGIDTWNYMSWSTSGTEMTGYAGSPSNNGAVKTARCMYPESDNGYGVVSTLTYGVQWDATLRWMQDIKNNNVNPNSFYIVNSTGLGNYTSVNTRPYLFKTGSNPNYSTKNIFDMAGNVYEWTMESMDTKRVIRGGSYGRSPSSTPVSYRYGYLPSDYFFAPAEYNGSIGFRVALYVK